MTSVWFFTWGWSLKSLSFVLLSPLFVKYIVLIHVSFLYDSGARAPMELLPLWFDPPLSVSTSSDLELLLLVSLTVHFVTNMLILSSVYWYIACYPQLLWLVCFMYGRSKVQTLTMQREVLVIYVSASRIMTD